METATEKSEKLRGALPIYEEVFSQYNKAVGLSKQKDFDALPNMFLNMLKTGAEIPLPVEIYKGSLFSMLVSGNREEFNKILADAPDYVHKNTEIKSIMLRLKAAQLQSLATQNEKESKKKLRTAAGILLAGAATFIAAAGLTIGGIWDRGADRVSAPNNSASADLNDKIESLMEENSLLWNELSLTSAELQEKEKITNLLESVDADLHELKESAAQKLYLSGMKDYQNGQYQTALEKLAKSLSISGQSYFSDDAHFFLIQTLMKTGDITAAIAETDSFLNQADQTNYMESPYLDDVMLLKAENLLKAGDCENAGKWLDRIESHFPDEWTSDRAKTLRQQRDSCAPLKPA